MHGFSCHGHFAEYSLADFRNAMVLPDGMDMIAAAPLFCAGVTGKFTTLFFETGIADTRSTAVVGVY